MEEIAVDRMSLRTAREKLASSIPPEIAPAIFADEDLASAGFTAPAFDRGAYLKLPPHQYSKIIEDAAHSLHEAWRSTRYECATGSFEPRLKETTDEKWIGLHGTNMVDIANTLYRDLPKDWQAENRASANVALTHLLTSLRDSGDPKLGLELAPILSRINQDAGNRIHEAWMDRNPRAPEALKKPFFDLPLSEQRKDLVILDAVIAAFENEIHIPGQPTSYATLRKVNIAIPIGAVSDKTSVFRLDTGLALAIVNREQRDALIRTQNDQLVRSRGSCPLPPGIGVEELVRNGAVPTSREFGDKKQGLLLLTREQAGRFHGHLPLRAVNGEAVNPSESIPLDEVRYHSHSHQRKGVVAYGFDLTKAQSAAAFAAHHLPEPMQTRFAERISSVLRNIGEQITGLFR